MSDEITQAPRPRMATAYHETVDDLRRELAGEALTFRKQMKPHQAVVFAAQEKHEDVPPAEREAYIGCLMAANYAYTLAAILRVAGDFGQEVCERLACVADDILTNGDDRERNADVMPPDPADGKDHECSFPCNPPGGTMWAPGPCTICGKTWDRAQAEKALAEAQAAMAATEAGS